MCMELLFPVCQCWPGSYLKNDPSETTLQRRSLSVYIHPLTFSVPATANLHTPMMKCDCGCLTPSETGAIFSQTLAFKMSKSVICRISTSFEGHS